MKKHTMKKHTLLTLLTVLSPIALTACQSTASLSADTNITPQQQLQLQSKQAKKALDLAMKAQLRRSFNYQSNIEFSNAIRRHALANASAEQLNSASNKYSHCEDTHDKAYIALLQKVDKQGNDVADGQYDDEKAKIRTDFLNCQANYDKWRDNYYAHDDSSNEEVAEYLPNYDSHHTAENAKKAELLNAYLYQPLDIQLKGTYQPLAGKFTLMPSISYQGRNLLLRQQLPIYVDFKKGELYVWADVLANPNSEFIDEKLGTQWKDKWLKLSLKDESLPKGFGENFLKLLLQATDVANKQESVEGFSYLTYEQVNSKIPYLNPEYYQSMGNARQIISREQSNAENERQLYIFRKELLSSLNKQYPQLMAELQDKQARKQLITDKEYGKWLLSLYVRYMQKGVKKYENTFLDDDGKPLAKPNGEDDGVLVKQYYGLDGDSLLWNHNRYEIINDKYPQEPTIIDAFTRFSKADDKTFAQLPVHARTPSVENSVDIKQYLEQLTEHYQQGGGTMIGKIVYQSYINYIQRRSENAGSDGKKDTAMSRDSDGTTEIITLDADRETDGEAQQSQCVLMSVSIEMMCEPDMIDVNNSDELAQCQQEQQEMQEAYEFYCE